MSKPEVGSREWAWAKVAEAIHDETETVDTILYASREVAEECAKMAGKHSDYFIGGEIAAAIRARFGAGGE